MSTEHLPEKPAWEVDFPTNRGEADHVTRREFAKFLVLLSGGMCIGTGWVAIKDNLFPPRRLTQDHRVCQTSEVPIGAMLAFELPDSSIPYILIHLTDREWRVFEQKCTHLSCAVFYEAALGKIACPCHHAFFDPRTGAVLQGPPPRPLASIPVEIRGNEVFVVPESTAT